MAPPSACRLTAADSLLSACPIFYVKTGFFFQNSGQGALWARIAQNVKKPPLTVNVIDFEFFGFYIQLNKYETAPKFIQAIQNLTSDCLLI